MSTGGETDGHHQPRTCRQGAGAAQGRARALRRARVQERSTRTLGRRGEATLPRRRPARCGKKPIAEWDVGGAARSSCGRRGTTSSARRSARPSAAWSASCATCATSGRTRSPSPATTPTARSTPPARLLTAVSAPAGRRGREDEDGAAARALRRAGARREAQGRRHRHRERGDRQPQALARGRDAARGRGQRPLPAGRVRRRPLAGAPGRGHGRVPRPGRVLPPHLPHREPASGCWWARVQRLAGQGGDPVVQLQTNFGGGKTHSMLALYHLFSGIAPTRAGRRRRGAGGGRRSTKLPTGQARGAGRQQDLARQPGHQAGRHGGAHAVGRAGLAARRQEGVRARRGRRREGHQPRRRAARAVQRVRAVPDPDRRVGGLRAPAPRPERPAGGQLRDPVHLRPGAHRVGQARQATACW